MGILSSMNTGISGLRAMGEAMGVTADNIANANTTGFKTSRAEFSDIIAKSLKGVLGGNQIGRGSKLAGVTPIFNQGSVVQTDRSTDLAIEGDAFFVLDGSEGRSYTRAGAFTFDKSGVLRNVDGYSVMGFQADEKGDVSSKMGEIKIGQTVIEANKTDKINFNLNLDLRDKIKEWNPEDPEKSSNFSTGVVVYDSAGNNHLVTMYFNKTAPGEWEYHAMVKGEEVPGGEAGTMVEEGNGKLKFNEFGKLQMQEASDNSFTFNNGAIPDQQISFNFGDDLESGGTGVLGATQYGTDSDVFKITQNGYTAGTLAGLSFNDDGMLSAIFTNGEVKEQGMVALAKFEHNEGLFKLGQSRFRESRKSGQPNIGQPGKGGRGKIFSKSLEESATDIAAEFVNMIKNQRAFQANSRTVLTSDELLQEILNWKRG